MKLKLFLLGLLLALFVGSASAQMYDGITQPTKFRVWIPTTIDAHSHSTTTAPFFGYKEDLSDWASITLVGQYNINKEEFIPQVWLNFNLKKKLYFLTRSIYNTKTEKYSHTVSATYKLPAGFVIDGTWDNLYNGKKFCDTDRLQFLGGWGKGRFACNAGYSVRNKKGFIANARFKVTDYNWLQLKWDGGTQAVCLSAALQWKK